jgi:predicted MFS family arabinose efflux permease
MFAATLANMLVPGVLPAFAAETGISMSAIGRSSAVFGIVYAVAAPLLALAVRRVPPFRVMLVALPVSAVTVLAVAAAPSAGGLFAARAVQAVAVAGVVPMCTVHAGTIVPALLRSRALSVSFGGMVLSSLVGAPLGNALGGLVGARQVFWVAAGVTLAAFGVLLAVRPWQAGLRAEAAGPAVHDDPAQRSARAVDSLPAAAPAAVAVLAAVLATAMLEGVATSSLNTFVSPYLTRTTGATGGMLSALLLCYGVAGLAGNALLGAVADRLGPARVLLAVTATAAVGVAALRLATSPGWAAALLLVWGFCSWAINPPLQALLIGHAGSHVRLAVAINSSVIFTGSSVGAAVAAAQVDAGGLLALPLTAGAAFAASAAAAGVAWWLSARRGS